ncbi:hypothetical protein AO372_1887 [Moraxella catarrhalis]|nr:hypothetical protein AO372_1887 [Moraxella catarrhalis]
MINFINHDLSSFGHLTIVSSYGDTRFYNNRLHKKSIKYL